MQILELESPRKSGDGSYDKQSSDRVVRYLAQRFALTISLATTIAHLAGLGEQEARR